MDDQQSEQLFKQAARIANLGHYVWDELGDRFIFASDEYARILGLSVDEIFTRYNTLLLDLKLVHPDDRERVLASYAEFEKSRTGYDIKYRITRPDGEERHVREIGDPIVDGGGRMTQSVGVLQDITELRHILGQPRELRETQQELTRNLAEARRAAQLVKLGTFVWDWKENRLAACSEEYARIHEMSVDEALQTFSSLEADYAFVHPDDRDRFAAFEAKAVAKGEDYSVTYRLLLPSGRICHVREACEVEFDEESKVRRTMGSVQDVTEHVELENQLRQARKMEAVGQLTSGLAHDFNNILAVVMGNLELAIEYSNEGGDKQEFLAEAMRGAQKGADLNKQLLTFSRRQVVAERVMNINEIIYNMSSLLARTLGEEIEIETAYSSVDCFSKLDPALLESAILNLAINARDAMTNGGKLRIATDVCPASKLTNNAGTDKEMVRISVSDNGTGMTDEVKEHAIEPFYTTKEVGAGNGLGLSMVYGFVTQASGRMEIETELGKGTTIHIIVPFADWYDNMPDTPRTHEIQVAVEGEIILVVEDQQNVREVVVRQLASLGYGVLEAEDGSEAIKILKSNQTIDLILSDMVMPGGMDGEDVVLKARKIMPNVKVLLMSGNPVRSDSTDGKMQAPLLQKPFRKADLARFVRNSLDGVN